MLNSNPHDLFYVLFNLRDKFYTSFLFVNCETAEKIFLTLLLRKIVKEISLFYFQSLKQDKKIIKMKVKMETKREGKEIAFQDGTYSF